MTNPRLLELANRLGNEGLPKQKAVEKEIIQKGLEVQANINRKDYVKVPNTNTLIAKFEPDESKGLTWEKTHYKLAENGLFMPSPALFMPYFMNVIDAYNGKIQLYDGEGNPISKQEIEDIYKHLTINHINNGAWSWLDAKFDGNSIKTNHKVIRGELKPQNSESLDNCLMEDCYASLIFNKQGLPTEKSKKQEYKQGKNIYYKYPRDGAVAWFVADSDGAYLRCDRNPRFSNSALGVFPCAEGTSKN